MEIKLFEVRAEGTLYAVMSIKLRPRNEAERWLLQRSGYGACDEDTEDLVISGPIDPAVSPNGGDLLHFSFGGFAWMDIRCEIMGWAQDYISQFWAELESGQVIDIDFLQQKTKAPRISDRLKGRWYGKA